MSLYGHAACTTALKCSMFNFITKTSHFAYLGMLFYLFIYALMLVAPSLRLWKTHRVLVYKFVVIMPYGDYDAATLVAASFILPPTYSA